MKAAGEKSNRSAASVKESNVSKTKKKVMPEKAASFVAEKSAPHPAMPAAESKQSVASMERLIRQQNEDIKADAEEKELLITALHLTQESLEKNLITGAAAEATNDELSTCLAKMRSAFPGYWDYDHISAETPVHTEQASAETELQWSISNLYLDGRLIHELEFTTVLRDGIAGIVIKKIAGKNGNVKLTRWPTGVAPGQDLECIPIRGSAGLGSNRILSSLSTSDWRFLKLLIDKLLELLSDEKKIALDSKVDRAALMVGLQNCKKILGQWPVILRYDDIELKGIVHGQQYHCFEIALSNMSLGDKIYPDFAYKISTIDGRGEPFGQNPRLEFPGSTMASFETWFAESSDQRGERLELRFALPAAMDTEVWGKLSDHDKILITALVADAPSQVLEISHNLAEKVTRREEWVGLANTIKAILQRYALLTFRKPDRKP
jgi:hypothetical protein